LFSDTEYVSTNREACSRTQFRAFSLLPAVRFGLLEDFDMEDSLKKVYSMSEKIKIKNRETIM